MAAAHHSDDAVSSIAAAIGERARARILYCLMANRARTSSELAAVANVSPSTASVHLARLNDAGLVTVLVQGKHRYYSLANANVAAVLESLSVLAGGSTDTVEPNTPEHLRAARTCYDHIAGTLGVALHDRLMALGWLEKDAAERDDAYAVTATGAKALASLGVAVDVLHSTRRRHAYACLDWSERRSHIGGAVGAALLALATKRKWIAHDRDTRALRVTALGHRELSSHFGLKL